MGEKLTTFSMSSCTNRIAVFNNFFSLICSEPRDKQNRVHDFFPFEYFLNNHLLNIFMETTLTKLVELNHYRKLTTHYQIKRGHSFQEQSVRNLCAKFKVDRLSRFCTGARQVFTTQKPFLSEIPLTMKTTTSNSL